MKTSTNQRFFDLDFKQNDDGTIRLTQNDCGEDSIIDAHPEQLKFIARRLCGFDSTTAAKVEDLERKLAILAGEINFIVNDEGFRKDLIDSGSGSEFELIARLDGLWNLAIEFDGGRLLPIPPSKEDSEPAPQSRKKQDPQIQLEL